MFDFVELSWLDEMALQEKVARKMNIERSGVSKKIDAFLKVSHKSQKSHL